MRNEAIDRVLTRASQRRYIALESDLVGDDESSMLEAQPASHQDVRPLAASENAEMKRVIEEAGSGLPENFRAVFMLREVEELSIEEIADMLGIPSATVRTRDHRARNLLRQKLGVRVDRTIPSTFEFLSTRCDRLVGQVMSRLTQ